MILDFCSVVGMNEHGKIYNSTVMNPAHISTQKLKIDGEGGIKHKTEEKTTISMHKFQKVKQK